MANGRRRRLPKCGDEWKRQDCSDWALQRADVVPRGSKGVPQDAATRWSSDDRLQALSSAIGHRARRAMSGHRQWRSLGPRGRFLAEVARIREQGGENQPDNLQNFESARLILPFHSSSTASEKTASRIQDRTTKRRDGHANKTKSRNAARLRVCDLDIRSSKNAVRNLHASP